MKSLLFALMIVSCSTAFGQSLSEKTDTHNVVLENTQLKVVEILSTPKGDVCGKGVHSHKPHLTVLLTDANVTITTPEGKSQDIEVQSGTTMWSESETHSVVNNGKNPTKMILVYLKE